MSTVTTIDVGKFSSERMAFDLTEYFTIATRLPFATSMVVALIATGVYGQTHLGPLDAQTHSRVGHSPHSLWKGQWQTVVTSVLFTANGWHFYVSLAMMAIAISWVELTCGTWIAIGTFVGIHVVTLLVMSIGIATSIALVESHRGNLLWFSKDVGPSAGYYGCLGLAITSLQPNWFWLTLVAIMVMLLARIGWSSYHLVDEGRLMSADIAHLIAFPLGLLLSRLVS